MSGRKSLIQQITQIDHRRYERLNACAKKQFDPDRMNRCSTQPPLRRCDQVVINHRTIQHQHRLTSATNQGKDVLQIEQQFRQTLTMRLQNPTESIARPVLPDREPLDQQVQLDMIQLAHEWGIHTYRAQTITEQIVSDARKRQRPSSKSQTLQRSMPKGKSKQLHTTASPNQHHLLIALITLFALIDLAIVFYML